MIVFSEPVIHSHITDELPDDHPLAHENVYCECDDPNCLKALHAFNNECMQTWVETGRGNYALACWIRMLEEEARQQQFKELGLSVGSSLDIHWGFAKEEPD